MKSKPKKPTAWPFPHDPTTELCQILFEQAGDGIFIADAQGRYLEVNPRGCEMLGYSHQELVGLSLQDILPAEELERDPPLLAGANVPQECRLRCKDGRLTPVEISTRRLADGRLLATVRPLPEDEGRYRELFENSCNVIAIVEVAADNRFKLLDINPTWEKMSGHKASQVLGAFLEDLVAPEIAPDVLEVYRRCLAGESPLEYERAVVTPIGQWHIYSTLIPVRNAAGKIYRIVSISRDFTTRSRLEEELRASEARYRAVVESQTELICRYLPDTTLTFVNDAYCRYWQKRREELLGQSFLSLIPGPGRQAAQAHIQSLIANPRLETKEHPYIFPNGEIRWQQWTDHPIIDQAGRVVEFQAVGRDTTERKQAEEALHLKQNAIETAINAIAISDAAGYLTYVNPAFLRLWGYDDGSEVLGKSALKFWQMEEQVAQVIATLHKTGGWIGELTAKRKDGALLELQVSASVVRDEQGQPINLMASFVDITERQRAEQIIQLRLRLMEFAATHSLKELLQQTLDEVGELTHSPIGFYHFVKADQSTLSLQAWSTRTLAEFCRAEGHEQHYPIDQAGVWVDCVRQRRAVIHNDYQTLPHRKGLPEGHAQVIRELVVPIQRDERIVAILGVGNKSQDYTDADVEVATYVADLVWDIIERKQVEAERTQLLEVLESSLNEIYIFDADTLRFQYVNSGALHNLGYSSEMMKAMTPVDLKPEFDELSFRALLKPLLRQEKNKLIFHTVHRRADHSFYPVEVYLQLHHYEGKRSFCAIILDITERKQAEEGLRESEERYRQLFELESDAILLIDNETGQILEANSAAAEM